MWNVGFKKQLQEILQAFLGECKVNVGRGSFQIEEVNEKVMVTLEEDHGNGKTIYKETLDYDGLYAVLVPKNQLKYCYLFSDLLREMKEEDAKEVVIKCNLKELLYQMAPVFMERKSNMEVLQVEPEVPVVKTESRRQSFEWVEEEVEFVQLTLF